MEIFHNSTHPTTRCDSVEVCGMLMSFHFGVTETILFKFWKTSSMLGILLSMLGIFILTISYEALKFYREYLFMKAKSANTERKMMDRAHAIQTLLQTAQFVISYCLMLIFMTYNIWLCLAITLGVTSGYFVFGWRKASIDHECCG